MKNVPQVITIGNSFELVLREVTTYKSLSNLATVDECHFGQKAAFWSTSHGRPNFVICTVAPSNPTLESIYGGLELPTFITPQRKSSSICHDLLHDSLELGRLASALDRERKVFLAPYVHTKQVEELATALMEMGFDLLDYRQQADLVQLLWNKVDADRMVFQPVDVLRKHRPKSVAVSSESDIPSALKWFARQGTNNVVVKSACAVGGSGVYFLNCDDAGRHSSAHDFLIGLGQNEADRAGPFIIEEHVQSDCSPTVDIEIGNNGEVTVIGTALQRLYDGRYYTGFYSSPELTRRWWYKTVENLACVVGKKLADLGYLGPTNIDFVVCSQSRRITLIEVNPRRSALIDGFSILRLKYDSRHVSISVADYINVASKFISSKDVLDGCCPNRALPAVVLLTADGGFSSEFRWVGMMVLSFDSLNSEILLEEVVHLLQDPDRNEIGSAQPSVKPFERIVANVA